MHRAIRNIMPLAALLVVLLPATGHAGPNAGGTMILSYQGALGTTCDVPPFQGELTQCEAAVLQIQPAASFPPPCTEYRVWYAYAAFPPGSLPRLTGICFGIDYTQFSGSTGIEVVSTFRDPDAAEFQSTSPPWPAPQSGTALYFSEAKTNLAVPIYGFVGYGSPGQFFWLKAHPDPSWGAYFADDYMPPNLDEIAGFGNIGFGVDGLLICPVPTTASCCLEDGSCIVLSPVDCVAQGDTPLHNGTTCDPNPCPETVGACCFGDGSCALYFEMYCNWAGGYYNLNGTLCTPDPCLHQGACCLADGSCLYIPQEQCPTGDWQWLVLCSTNPCPPPFLGACCDLDTGECSILTALQCADLGAAHQWLGPETNCSPNPCPPVATRTTTWGQIKHQYR